MRESMKVGPAKTYILAHVCFSLRAKLANTIIQMETKLKKKRRGEKKIKLKLLEMYILASC